MYTVLYRIIGIVLGHSLLLYASKSEERIKFQWLAYFLMGTGESRVIPKRYAKDWNRAMVKPISENKYLIRPFPSELFWLVGSMVVTVVDGMVYGEDIYNFAPQLGQRVVFGSDKSLQWAWSGGESDPTRIKTRPMLTTLMKALHWYGRYVKDENGYYLVSNELWNVLGGKPFTSILRYEDDK